MIKLRLLKLIADLKPEKQLTIILILAVVGLFAWVKILILDDKTSSKIAYAKAEKKCDEEKLLLSLQIAKLLIEKDSLIGKAINEKQQTIDLLRQILNSSQKIKEKLNQSNK